MAVTQNIDGIEIDLNKVSRKEAMTLMGLLGGEPENMTGLIAKVVISWPFKAEITEDGFNELGFGDSLVVQSAVLQASSALVEKK